MKAEGNDINTFSQLYQIHFLCVCERTDEASPPNMTTHAQLQAVGLTRPHGPYEMKRMERSMGTILCLENESLK